MKTFLILALVLYVVPGFTQELPSIKFGKISESDLSRKSYSIDTGASAVVLSDIGSTQVKGNSKGWFSLEFKVHRRTHILKTSGYDVATVQLPVFSAGDDEEEIKDLKAVTYNLEGGKVVETKLNPKTALFSEKINKYVVVKKFTLPNVKEGSIIEYEYKLVSDFLERPRPWTFQSSIPHLWSQYTISLPHFLNYSMVAQGNLPFYLQDQKEKESSYLVEVKKDAYMGVMTTDRLDISSINTDFRWAMKDVPAFHKEEYTSTTSNYVAKLEFQLSAQLPPLNERKFITTWPDMTMRLLKREDFGGALLNNDLWLPAVVSKITQGVYTEPGKATKIFEHLRDNFICTSYDQLYADEHLEKISNKKKGGVADINLLLIAMLRTAGLQAEPVILSTRENGLVNDEFPVANQFNYVICKAIVNGKEVFLDASRPRMGFGKLHYDCYNGSARVVNDAATLINLNPERAAEESRTTIFIYNEGKGKWTGYVDKQLGYFASHDIRQKIGSTGGVAVIEKDLKNELANELVVDSVRVDSLKDLDAPLTMHYIIRSENEGADIIYMNPVLGERYKQNPFKSADRQYPVEIPYRINRIYTMNMDIPEGYVVDEMPKPVRLALNKTNEGLFEYKISQAGGKLTVNYNLELKRAVFFPAEYAMLREFFTTVVAKLDEQVVFKKKP